MFHSDANPGVVHLPVLEVGDVVVIGQPPVADPPLKLWFGLGEKHGGILVSRSGSSGKSSDSDRSCVNETQQIDKLRTFLDK